MDGKTRVCGLIANPVEHSMSPLMQNFYAERTGVNLAYVPFKVEDDKVDITLFVIMEYGVNIGTVGDIIKSNVKYQVEEATGLKVSSVTVNVESIRIH